MTYCILTIKKLYSTAEKAMKTTKFGQDFFDSTRGRIVGLVRRGVGTVEELAKELQVTDNAIRAHLATLERDKLVERRGTQPGSRKPHFAYVLSSEAEELFPKAYSTLFNQLLAVLKRQLAPEQLEMVLREVARSLAEGNKPSKNESTKNRVQRALAAMESMGGAPNLIDENGKQSVTSVSSCPFDTAVAMHPEVCRLAEIFLSEVTGLELREHCRKGEQPKCSFELVNI